MKRRQFFALAGSSAMLSLAETGVAENSEDRPGTILEAACALPVAHEADVVVCGGGPAGVAAALAAARKGKKTVLLESASCLGGIWTAGALCLILDYKNKTGIMAEILERLQKLGGLPDFQKNHGLCYDVETMKFLLDGMCAEAGVTVQLFTQVADAVVRDGRLTAVVTESKSGREAVTGKVFIDCTGDGDLAARAGCGFDFGRPEDGSFMPMSLMALLTGLDAEQMRPFTHRPDTLLAEMRRCGVEPSYRRPSLWYLNDHLFGLMTTHAHELRGIDVRELTRAQIQTRAELNRLVRQLRESGGVWQNLRLAATAEKIGVREGRRIHGRYTLTEQDLREGRTHEDAACRVTYCVDVHSPRPRDPGQSSISEAWTVKPYDIPMRALIAKDVEGLLLAGRCISGDFLPHASYRVTGNAVPMGEAAGNYAAEHGF